ncbi:MAG: aminotransferase class I/II-fold pyridoxal phosphate-dependent enzyme, partial [Clostridia bacterium]|nr:aminotransferase class I/II-fold pyridoxal phosphate-dependent enzyme [Clostridia bacterium]
MIPVSSMTTEQLRERRQQLRSEYEAFCARGLHLDLSRGKPGPDLLDLTLDMLDCVNARDGYTADSGVDTRNYGVPDGIPEAKQLFADILDVAPDNILVGGNSSLNLMYDYIATAYAKGVCGHEPWSRQGAVKFLCPVPGYDRHFAITEFFGIEMICIPMTADGPDMDAVENAVRDPLVKGIWCVPMYSNPTGITYSDETVRRLAALTPAAEDFRIMWDNAYCLHHLYDDRQDRLLNLYREARTCGHEDAVIEFTSTSKISFPGSGIAAVAASPNNIADIKKRLRVETIGYDKINMLRHVRYFGGIDGVREQMRLRAQVLRPKFDLVLRTLEEKLGGRGIATWTDVVGGYFVSVDLHPGCAKKTAELMRGAGIILTGAGATFPYGVDPQDANLRLAPSYPPIEELGVSMELFCLCAELV